MSFLRQRTAGAAMAFFAVAVCLLGCYTVVQPTPPQNWTALCARQIPELGKALLDAGLAQGGDGVVLLKLGGMLDKTRFTVDTDLLMKKMRTYLVNNGRGRVAVFDNDSDVAAFCENRRRKVLHGALKGELKYLAGRVVRAAIFRSPQTRLAVMPVTPGDGEKVNADALVSLLRDEIVLQGDGRFVFLSPDRAGDADYLLRGSLTAFDADLNLRIVFEKPDAVGVPCFEASMPVRKKAFDVSLDATYILAGELNVLTRETRGYTDDYVRMGFNVVDPETRLHKWEVACDISTTSYKSVLYQ